MQQELSEEDAATHYDLGVAYHEMGLHHDAIYELGMAARDPNRTCVCLWMIGTIHMQLGEIDAALDGLHRALRCTGVEPEQQWAIGYEIANAYEHKLMTQQALKYFEWLASVAPDYRDARGHVAERIQRLRTESGAQRKPSPPARRPVPEDVEAAIDDLASRPR